MFHLLLRDDPVETDFIFCILTLVFPLGCLGLAVDFDFLGPAEVLAATLVTRVAFVATNFPLPSGLGLFLVLEVVVAFLGFLALGACELSGVEALFLERLPVDD